MDDDGYGVTWEYRVLSRVDTEPDQPNVGRRWLAIHKVHWVDCRRVPDYPVPSDGCGIVAIDHQTHGPCGATIDALHLDIERMRRALDRPALIWDEWKDYLTVTFSAVPTILDFNGRA